MFLLALLLFSLINTVSALAEINSAVYPKAGPSNLQTTVQTASKPSSPAPPKRSETSSPEPRTSPEKPQSPETWWGKFTTDPNATFAGAVALFTLGLVFVGYLQFKKMNETLKATEKIAKATEVSAEATLKMAKATEVSAEATKMAAEATFSIERPSIVARDPAMVVSPSDRTETFDLTIGPFVQILAKNTGRTPAKLKSLAVRTLVLRNLPTPPSELPPIPFQPGRVLENGESEYIFQKCSYIPGEATEVLTGRKFWWAYGYILYTDFSDREHKTGFCFRWHPPGMEYPNGKWLYVNDPDYVYLT